MQKRFIAFAGFSAAIAVLMGAFAAHFLKTKVELGLITEANLQTFETGARYQMYHSIALVLVALLLDKIHNKLPHKAGLCFMAGIVLFSGSLYLLSTASLIGMATGWLGPITPIGGLFFISGWLLLAYSALKKVKN